MPTTAISASTQPDGVLPSTANRMYIAAAPTRRPASVADGARRTGETAGGNRARRFRRCGRCHDGRTVVAMSETNTLPDATLDVAVVGGGQAGLALAWHLRRRWPRFAVLDANAETGDV